jgi:hypothetical protein
LFVLQDGGALMRGPILYLTGASLVCLLGVLSLCGWLLTESALTVHNARPGLEQTAWTLRYLNDCKANRACLASQLLATTGSVKAAAAQSYQTSRSVEATARESLELVRGLRTDTHDLLAEARGTLHEATELERALRQDLDRIAGTADATIVAVQAPLHRLDALLATADAQLAANGQVTQKTLQDIARAARDLDVLFADPNVATTLANVAGTSEHLEESAKSIDIAMRPWREKASMLKTVISKALDLLKFTIPIPLP